jgi:hypothetical protein
MATPPAICTSLCMTAVSAAAAMKTKLFEQVLVNKEEEFSFSLIPTPRVTGDSIAEEMYHNVVDDCKLHNLRGHLILRKGDRPLIESDFYVYDRN